MELLDGESLDSRAARSGGRLPVDEVLAVADQLLDVLIAAHDKGVVHRDLKPENVFLTRDGQVRVLDFGIARLREISSQSTATRDGAMMGTPAYMPPEQARGLWEEVDARADLWAVGATMFALITGRPVHEGRTTNEVLVHAVTQKATPLGDVIEAVPELVAALVDRALAFEKEERWPDARAMQNALRHAYHSMHGTPISSHPRPIVPESVPNRTLPSAGMEFPVTLASAGTGPAVVAGRTDVPLRMPTVPGIRRVALFAAGAVATIAVLIAFVILIRAVASVGEKSTTVSSATFSPEILVAAPEATPTRAPPTQQGDDAGAGKAAAKRASPPRVPIATVVSPADASTVPPAPSVSAPTPAPPPKPATTSWKDLRK
jgi:serine/threonine-protein kinase